MSNYNYILRPTTAGGWFSNYLEAVHSDERASQTKRVMSVVDHVLVNVFT